MPVDVTCAFCGKYFKTQPCRVRRAKSLYCSPECRSLHYKVMFSGVNAPYYKGFRTCAWCGRKNVVTNMIKRQNKFFCSISCREQWERKNIPEAYVKCANCGKEFRQVPVHKDHKIHFCSKECEAEWRKKNIRGEKHPRFKGLKISCSYCGKEFLVPQGRKETAKFCSASCRNKYYWKQGIMNRWLHGKDFEQTTLSMFLKPYPPSYWRRREKILERDGFKCKICGSSLNLTVHHIDGNKHNNSLDNLTTLCKSCHSRITRLLETEPSIIYGLQLGNKTNRSPLRESPPKNPTVLEPLNKLWQLPQGTCPEVHGL